jgi:hypothetical protein
MKFVQSTVQKFICGKELTETTKTKNYLKGSVEEVIGVLGLEGFAVPDRKQKATYSLALLPGVLVDSQH